MSRQSRKRRIRSAGSRPGARARLSARASAMAVSSVHWPRARRCGPPCAMSSRTAKRGLGENSMAAPTASPTARPSRAPTARSRAASRSRAGGTGGTARPALTHASCGPVSMAPGRTARTALMASAGAMPPSTSSRALIVPARPSPPLQWTSTRPPQASRERSMAERAGQAASNSGVRHAVVLDGPVVPLHVPAPDLGTQGGDAQAVQLVRLDQGDDRRRVPGGDGVEVGPEVAPVRAGQAVRLLLAGREGDADPAAGGAHGDLGDAEGVAGAGQGRAGRVMRAIEVPRGWLMAHATQP